MSVIAIVDLETTGLDPKVDRVIEASWAYVDVETAKVVSIHSRLFKAETNAAESVNGIPLSLLSAFGGVRDPIILSDDLDASACAGTPPLLAILAHNAAFDSQWGVFEGAPWVCTKDDVEWPCIGPGKKLIEVALAHGVGVVSAHRAFADVLTLCLTLERAHEKAPLKDLLAKAMTPRKTFAALVSYDDREKARAAGFSWKPSSKQWVRRMAVADVPNLPFKAVEVSP